MTKTCKAIGISVGIIAVFCLRKISIRAEKKCPGAFREGHQNTHIWDADARLQAWIPVYTQSAESLRDTVKILAGASIAGLAASITTIAATNSSSTSLNLSVVFFLAGLVCAVLPSTALSDKFDKEARAIAESIYTEEFKLPTARLNQWAERFAFWPAIVTLIWGISALAIHHNLGREIKSIIQTLFS